MRDRLGSDRNGRSLLFVNLGRSGKVTLYSGLDTYVIADTIHATRRVVILTDSIGLGRVDD